LLFIDIEATEEFLGAGIPRSEDLAKILDGQAEGRTIDRIAGRGVHPSLAAEQDNNSEKSRDAKRHDVLFPFPAGIALAARAQNYPGNGCPSYRNFPPGGFPGGE
jgi:hypothetical protein